MDNPRVGIASLVLHDHQLLLGPRCKAPESGSWQLPGGYIAAGETVVDAAIRLAQEKAGAHIQLLQQGPYTNNIFPDGSHTVSLYVLAELHSGQKKEHVAEGWRWFHLHDLPQPLFLPLKLLLDQQVDWLKSVGIFK
ncbi:MAG: NUDIX domain-containing protein [Gammaproteobacteria bacterium]|nr:NUDIX domain-containing protein [Gammaproteobacteria bacterium]